MQQLPDKSKATSTRAVNSSKCVGGMQAMPVLAPGENESAGEVNNLGGRQGLKGFLPNCVCSRHAHQNG